MSTFLPGFNQAKNGKKEQKTQAMQTVKELIKLFEDLEAKPYDPANDSRVLAEMKAKIKCTDKVSVGKLVESFEASNAANKTGEKDLNFNPKKDTSKVAKSR